MSESEGAGGLPPDATIIAALPPPPRSAHLRDIARFLGLADDGRRALRERLRVLADAGRVQRDRGNRYGRPGASAERVGTLTMTARGFGFISAEGGGEDIFVAARNVGVAMHRDRVRARVVEESDGRREGVIVGVVERGTSTFVGTYRAARRGAWVTPQDPRLGEQYSVEQSSVAKEGDLVAASFVRWPDDQDGALVRVLRVLAVDGDAAQETDVIVNDLGLPVEFSPEAEAEATAARPPSARAMQGRYQEAFLLSDKTSLATDLNTVGYAAMMRGDLTVAEAYFNRALSLNPQFDRAAWANLQYLAELKAQKVREPTGAAPPRS
jgi:exoribonuclease R